MPLALASLFRAISFLTQLPAPSAAFDGAPPLARDVGAFPWAGLVAAAPAAAVLLAVSSCGLSSFAAAVFAIATLVAITGALHEDGLADAADGLFGHHDRERALAIMRDSRIGTYGALALGLSLLARVALLAEMADRSAPAAALALLAAAAASRGAMGWLWASLPPARSDGLAKGSGQPDLRHGRQAALFGGLILLALAATSGLPTAILSFGGAIAATLAMRAFFRKRLGGHTGDGLGATQQIVEIAVLTAFALTPG